jgi:site-specific DNA-cytosine methylase
MLWTAASSGPSKTNMADYVLQKARALGYLVFGKLIDGAWYGVPQHRTRLFLLGLHRDLGYRSSDFGDWGPFPRPTHGPLAHKPFATVADAISDLPPVENGYDGEQTKYEEPRAQSAFLRGVRRWSPRSFVWDHVVSLQSDYVIERYRQVPEGGNWKDIAHLLGNYAGIERTHSNIYRRLMWDAPAVTMGHYRKSMLIHPSQDRGLSLREAARLQGFPDWFRFCADSRGSRGGLDKKQQQLANAVSPMITRSLAEFIARL